MTRPTSHFISSLLVTVSLLFQCTLSMAEVVYPTDVRIVRGSISGQPLSVLNQLQQSGSSEQNNDWNAYVEVTPDKKRFNGHFVFEVDPAYKQAAISAIRVATNTLAAGYGEQRWSFQLRDFQAKRWVWVYGNRVSTPWHWYQREKVFKDNPQRFINQSGSIKLRYISNNNADVSAIDFMQVEIVERDSDYVEPNQWKDISIQSRINKVQPMTGLVLWADSHNNTLLKQTDEFVQLEYAYVRPSDVVVGDGQYDWSSVESLLNDIASRGKQAILRWYYVYPGRVQTAVPSYIKGLADYSETIEISEGQRTGFPDWSHPELQQAHLDFYTEFARRYDYDPRIAFLQVGFGLWGEYHIYDPEARLGDNFPSKPYQAKFLQHLSLVFKELKWSVSIDAGDSSFSAIPGESSLLNLAFGNFDDSFMHQQHNQYNEEMWNVLGYWQRYKTAPHGGELSYYSSFDQRHGLDEAGMYGRTYEELSAKFHISYMIGNDQPSYQTNARIKSAGLANGYKFKITEFKASSEQSKVTVVNEGVAPIYYDAFITVNEVRSSQSLKGLLPGQSLTVTVNSGGVNPVLTIESDRLVQGQKIGFEANL